MSVCYVMLCMCECMYVYYLRMLCCVCLLCMYVLYVRMNVCMYVCMIMMLMMYGCGLYHEVGDACKMLYADLMMLITIIMMYGDVR